MNPTWIHYEFNWNHKDTDDESFCVSLKKKTIQFSLSFNLYFQQKKEPQSCQFATYWQNALFEFLTSQTGQMAFPIFKVIMR